MSQSQERRRPFDVRTGAEQPWEPEDIAVSFGKDPTPETVERYRRRYEEEGAALIEKAVP